MAELQASHYRTLQHCMNDIVETVVFDEVKEKLVAKGIITPEELEKLLNQDAVMYIVKKVMNSNNNVYSRFLKVLKEMEQPRYAKLWQTITNIHEHEDDEDNGHHGTASEKHGRNDGDIDHTFSYELRRLTDSINEADELAKEIIEQQTTLERLAIKIQEKSIVGKTFTNILIYVCRLFCKAIEDETIRFVGSSRKQYILKELRATLVILTNIKDKFDPEYPASHQEQKHEFIQYIPLSILLDRANKIAEIVKGIWQPFWRRWSPSKMAMLLSLYEGVTKVVQGINNIDHDCSSFCELIGDIQQLRQCLESVDAILQGLCKSNLVLCVTLGAGAVICVVLGAVLIPTPAVAATLPLLITGGVLAWQSSLHLGVAAFSNKVTAVADQSKEIGYYKGQELLKESNVEDSQQYQQVEGNQNKQLDTSS